MVSLAVRLLCAVLALIALAAGGLGAARSHAPDLPVVPIGRKALEAVVPAVATWTGRHLRPDDVERGLADPMVVLGACGSGLLLLLGAARFGRSGRTQNTPEERGDAPAALAPSPPGDVKAAKKLEKRARALAKKGIPKEAAELCFEAGLYDAAAGYFEQAEQWIRAAEIRHGQNRLIECAELYLRAGEYDDAGKIFASKEEWGRAAEAYLEVGRLSVAAEMFEKGSEFQRAGDCYVEAGFHRHAARAFVKAKSWGPAARALEETIVEESTRGGGQDVSKLAEVRKLVLQAAKLWEQAGDIERAQAALERGECWTGAAELALRRERFDEAASLFVRAHETSRAAEALRRHGSGEAASRLLGEHHRDKNEYEEAARCFEEAGEWVQAGDLLRQIEAFGRAAECFERAGEHLQAGEMFRLAEHPARAAQNYERAGHHADAAACWAACGDSRKEADALLAAGRFLRAGEAYRRLGLVDDAIRILQQAEAGSEDFQTASALLGELFREKGELSLAITKVKQAVGDAVVQRETLPTFYTLARLHEERGQLAEAAAVYERILTLDYHYEDVAARLAQTRARIEVSPSQPRGDAAGSGERPGRYEVLSELGRGGMGIVYKAKDTVLDRIVAYKTLPEALRANPQAVRNFLREAKSAAQLNHPNIVTIYDAGEHDGLFYIAMEYVDGTTLKEVLRKRKVIPPNGVLHVLTQMCEALAYAHDKKIIHRDIKTANTMWTRDRKAKIMDFGLAKVVEEVRNHTTLISGTPYYMSPEQTLGNQVDHRTDIYSLGVSIFELATGSLPFRDGNVPYHHVHTPPPDPCTLNPLLPAALGRLVLRCLVKDPGERYQSTRDILAEIRAMRATGTALTGDGAS